MLPDIDFSTIRPWRGSRHSAFEELCCQLYSLEPPAEGSSFFRKEGAGGDAGLECLWTLPDEGVHGLQSKYFLGPLGSSQWSQIDRSVTKALERHPTLTRYTVCLPRDLTDRRVEGEASQPDQWDARVEKWNKWADARGMSVEFRYWGSFELTERLSRDDPRYQGRTLYWFGAPLLTTDWFRQKLAVALANLGERYTPEAHVELPIRALFEGLCRTANLFKAFQDARGSLRQTSQRLASAVDALEQEATFAFDPSRLRDALERLEARLGAALPDTQEDLPVSEMTATATAAQDELTSLHRALDGRARSEKGGEARSSERVAKEAGYFALRLNRELNEALSLLHSPQVAAANVGAALIDGEAGMGKSHLFADVAHARLEEGQPTVLLLGQHVAGGNPWDAFLSELDLNHLSVEQFLGALDAAGQAARSRALLLVDAVNEGGGRHVWRDRLGGFLASLEPFPHVAVGLSCRTTYVRSIGAEAIPAERLTRVTHRGFEGHETTAASIYLDRYGLSRPNRPLLTPEFSNPLFLKTCCEALHRKGETSFPKGVRGVKSVFRLYVDSLDSVLEARLDVDPRDGIAGRALGRLADQMAAAGRGVLPRPVARRLLNELHPATGFQDSLLHHLLAEGALAEDLEYPAEADGEPEDVIRFSFERFSDHFIAERLLDDHVEGDVDAALAPDAPLGAQLRDPKNGHLGGVLEALAVQLPERYGRELIALFEGSPLPGLAEGFLRSVIWRESTACTEETAEWLTRLGGHGRGEPLWDTLLHVAAEPDHPFNADHLHRHLLGMELPDRDERWSIYAAEADRYTATGEPESIARTLIRWAWDSDTSGAEDETARLCAVALTWLFTTSNRGLRDHATKALASLLAERPHLVPGLLEAFHEVNDPYVAERLYCAVYGAVLQGVPEADLEVIAQEIDGTVFREGRPPPHVLLRDYARGVIEYALHRGCLPEEVDPEKARPPYSSEPWPLEFPSEEEARAGDIDPIRSSVLSMGDFGRYVMGDQSSWSPTPLSERRPETAGDRVEAFRARIAEDPDPAIKKAFEELERLAAPLAGASHEARALFDMVQRMRDDDRIAELPGREQVEALATAIDEAEQTLINLLPKGEQRYFRNNVKPYLSWGAQRHLADHPVRLDIADERRWVWRRAHDLGWSPERFESFERTLPGGRGERDVERVGKKYQWIAWHELQARLSDHLYLVGGHWSEAAGSTFRGPWEVGARDIDPSLLARARPGTSGVEYQGRVWWRPAHIEHPDESTEARVARLWRDEGFPDLKSLLRVHDPDGDPWLVLKGMSIWRELADDQDPRPRRDTWLRIEAFLVERANRSSAVEALVGESLVDPYALENDLDLKVFLGEHPWHPICEPNLDAWRPAAEVSPARPIPVRHFIPTVRYVWEPGRDRSVEALIEFELPSKFLRQELALAWEGGRGASFRGGDGSMRLFDPTTTCEGPPACLVAEAPFLRLLESRDLALVWRIGGEKGLYGRGFDPEFHGRQVLSAVYFTEGDDIIGSEWRKEERPPPDPEA